MVQAPSPIEVAPSLDALVNEINQYETLISEWNEEQRATVSGLRRAIETLHREALTRLIRQVKQQALPALRQAAEDEVVCGILHYYDLIKPPRPPLEDRVRLALAEVRPGLQGHGGDVELVKLDPPLVEVRLIGACSHCPASSLTLSQGVEEAVKRYCPEITQVIAVSHSEGKVPEPKTASDQPDLHQGWLEVTSLAEVPRNSVLAMKLEGRSLLLSRIDDDQVVCFPNACSHLGVPLDAGEVDQGILTCPYHHFRYQLATGECLTAPEMPLQSLPVQVKGGQVYVQLWGQP
jgi:nitrite reductase/ring-hydroxylating ferredoxin subunit/Fe-S cluster biogenesis protein NfuA